MSSGNMKRRARDVNRVVLVSYAVFSRILSRCLKASYLKIKACVLSGEINSFFSSPEIAWCEPLREFDLTLTVATFKGK